MRSAGLATSPPDGAAGRLRVLLVEDNPGDIRLVQEALSDNSIPFDVDVATRLSEGLESLGRQAPDVALLDLGLPDSSGLATYEAVRSAHPDIPVVILTVTGDEELAVSAVKAGAQDYLVKDELPPDLLPRALRYARERHQAVRELEKIAEDLRMFIAQAVHDLTAPISTVAGFADLLERREGVVVGDDMQDVVHSVRRQAHRLEDLVRDLLDLAKIGQEVELEPVDLGEVVERALQAVPPPEHVELDVATNGGPVTFRTEPARLERLLTNLLTNGYRYGAGRVLLSIDTTATDRVELAVEDDGDGVPTEFVPSLFTPFARGPNHTRESTGLGLSIVRRLAEGFGGSVSYERGSRLGGARFVVSLPREGTSA